MDQQAEKDRKSNRTRQKNKRGESKVESNDSPEIPDRGESSDIPGLPSGGGEEGRERRGKRERERRREGERERER